MSWVIGFIIFATVGVVPIVLLARVFDVLRVPNVQQAVVFALLAMVLLLGAWSSLGWVTHEGGLVGLVVAPIFVIAALSALVFAVRRVRRESTAL